MSDVGADGMSVVAARPIVNDTCGSVAYCWPMKGGIRIYLVSNHSDYCTTGFIARTTNTGDLVALTAGHCLALSNSTGTDYWGHAITPTGAGNFGWELGNTWSDLESWRHRTD
jgi:hypothetical protein